MDSRDAAASPERDLWSAGDYHLIGRLIHAQGPALVRWSGVGPDDRVLDVGAGSGNASLAAAAAGAEVIATDISPELLAIGEREARSRGLNLTWQVADAADLPFPDDSFDATISAIGAMFAPDHRATADELLRVTRPGGVVAMANWTSEGAAARFSGAVAPYVPPPPAGPSPTAWGDADYVRELFGNRVISCETEVASVTVDFPGTAEELAEFYLTHHPPLVAVARRHDGDPARVAALAEGLRRFFSEEMEQGGSVAYEYLLVRAKVR